MVQEPPTNYEIHMRTMKGVCPIAEPNAGFLGL